MIQGVLSGKYPEQRWVPVNMTKQEELKWHTPDYLLQ
jgi:hypothetical protein